MTASFKEVFDPSLFGFILFAGDPEKMLFLFPFQLIQKGVPSKTGTPICTVSGRVWSKSIASRSLRKVERRPRVDLVAPSHPLSFLGSLGFSGSVHLTHKFTFRDLRAAH